MARRCPFRGRASLGRIRRDVELVHGGARAPVPLGQSVNDHGTVVRRQKHFSPRDDGDAELVVCEGVPPILRVPDLQELPIRMFGRRIRDEAARR